MQTIGEKLEEARKQRGISIREAAETTKIRGEYLSSFENNTFDINLPEIYVRGFLRNYARFLKLNPDKIIADYNASLLSTGTYAPPQRESRELYGTLDLVDRKPAPAPARTPKPATKAPPERPASLGTMPREEPKPNDPQGTLPLSQAEDIDFKSDPEEPVPARFQEGRSTPTEDHDSGDYQPFDKTLYLKIGVILGGSVVLIILIVSLISALRTSPDQVTDNGDDNGAITQNDNTIAFELRATGDISRVTVTEVQTNNELFTGSLSAGTTIPLRREGPVRITWTNGENLRIVEADQSFRAGSSGFGQATFGR